MSRRIRTSRGRRRRSRKKSRRKLGHVVHREEGTFFVLAFCIFSKLFIMAYAFASCLSGGKRERERERDRDVKRRGMRVVPQQRSSAIGHGCAVPRLVGPTARIFPETCPRRRARSRRRKAEGPANCRTLPRTARTLRQPVR